MQKVLIVVGVIVVIVVGLGVVMMKSFANSEISFKPNPDQDSLVQPVKFGHANVYFIRTDDGLILVDDGMPGDPATLDEVFATAGVDPDSIRLIVVTHGHMDHMGLTAYAKEATGADVLCHESLSGKLAEGEVEASVAQNLMGRFINFIGSLQEMTGGANIEGVDADIQVDRSFDLSGYGLAGKVIHTPGHSQSSLSIVLDNGEMLIGDMVRDEGDGQIGPGMFYEDRDALIASLEQVAMLDSSTIYLSHGDSIDNADLKNAIAMLKE